MPKPHPSPDGGTRPARSHTDQSAAGATPSNDTESAVHPQANSSALSLRVSATVFRILPVQDIDRVG